MNTHLFCVYLDDLNIEIKLTSDLELQLSLLKLLLRGHCTRVDPRVSGLQRVDDQCSVRMLCVPETQQCLIFRS